MRKYSPKRKYSTTPNKKTNTKKKYGKLTNKTVTNETATPIRTVYNNIVNFIGTFFNGLKR
jgi:hypothetical protein